MDDTDNNFDDLLDNISPEERGRLLQGGEHGPGFFSRKKYCNPAGKMDGSLGAVFVTLLLTWAGDIPICSECDSVCVVYANGQTSYKCRKHDPALSFPAEASHVQHPTISKVCVEDFNSSQEVLDYKHNPVSSPRKGRFTNFEQACQAVKEMCVPRVPLSFQNSIYTNNAGMTKAKSPSSSERANKKRKAGNEAEGKIPKAKRHKITLRGLSSNLLLPAIIRLLYGGIGYEKPKDFTGKDVDDMVTKVLRDGEDSNINFHLFGDEDEGDRAKALVFWAARFFLDCIEAAEVFGLLDALINILLTAKNSSNFELVEVLASLGYQISLCSRLLAIKAQETSVGKQRSSSLMVTSDRTPSHMIFLGVKIRLMRDLLRLLSRTGFFPSTSFSPAARQYSNEFIDMFDADDEVNNVELKSYLLLMCKDCDVRNQDAIAEGLLSSCWSGYRNKSMVFPVFHAAYIGLLMKMFVWGEAKRSVFQFPLARATGTTDKITFVNGYGGNGAAKLLLATSFNDFQLPPIRGTELGVSLVGENFLSMKFDFCGDFASGRTVVDAGNIFSFNLSSSGDILYGGRTPKENETILAAGLRRVLQYGANHPTITDMISREAARLNAVANLAVEKKDAIETYGDIVEVCAIDDAKEGEITETGAVPRCNGLFTQAQVSGTQKYATTNTEIMTAPILKAPQQVGACLDAVDDFISRELGGDVSRELGGDEVIADDDDDSVILLKSLIEGGLLEQESLTPIV